MNKKQLVNEGDVFVVPLGNGKYMYGREMRESCCFYSIVTETPITSITELDLSKKLFQVGVYDEVLTSGVWPVIANVPFENEDSTWGDVTCIVRPRGKSTYYSKGKEFGNPKVEDCYDMEHVIVYDRYDLEARLLHYCETKEDHPRMWDGYTADGNNPWVKIRKHELIDIVTLNKKYAELGWVPLMK